MAEDQPPIISTSSALVEKNALRAKLQADMDKFLCDGGSVRDDAAEKLENNRFTDLSAGKRRMKNNSDVFGGK